MAHRSNGPARPHAMNMSIEPATVRKPVMAALFAWVLLGEALVPLQIAGGIVVLIGIYLARRGSN